MHSAPTDPGVRPALTPFLRDELDAIVERNVLDALPSPRRVNAFGKDDVTHPKARLLVSELLSHLLGGGRDSVLFPVPSEKPEEIFY
jgi:hypothetical protein